MDSEFRELYQEIIMDHNRHPRNFRKMDDATYTMDGRNPVCGDHYKIYLKVENNIVTDVSFEGSGCAISKASASVMTQVIKGKSVEEAKHQFEIFHDIVTGKKSVEDFDEDIHKIAVFAGVAEFPVRVKCASLSWHTMNLALSKGEGEGTTE
jgi:nitrogen fixation NifU-like protein